MKKLCCLALIICLMPGFAFGGEMDLYPAPQEDPPSPTQVQISDAPLLQAPPINLNCGAALLAEMHSGQILFEMNADVPRPVASVTKVMTILLTLEAIRDGRIHPQQKCTISKNAAGMGGSQVLLDVGEEQTVDVLLKSMIVGSANDASVALAELMYGSEELCVQKMNERAAQLGMENTVFKNCTGLPVKGQHTTARDAAIMTLAMLSHEMYFDYSAIWLDEVDHGGGRKTQLTNTNKLTRLYDGCDGGKTGSTDEAGFCIAATAKRGDMRLVAVVLGASSGSERFDIAAEMLDYGFANYRLYPVAQKGTKIRGRLPVEGGRPDGVSLALDEEMTLLVPKGGESGITLVPELPEKLTPPVAIGQQAGCVRVEMDGRILARLPVITTTASEIRGLGSGIQRLLGLWGFSGV